MRDKILSIHEIGQIESAYAHGAPTLGFAATKLIDRWQFGLRDEETLIRLIFLLWYSRTGPPFLTGLSEEFNGFSLERLLDEFGGEERLGAESHFIIATLGHSAYAFGLGDESNWQSKSREFFVCAAEGAPASFLFGDWKYLVEEAGDTINLKTKMEAEIHARFAGRGYMGDYLIHILSGRVRPNQ